MNEGWKDELIRELIDYGAQIRDFIAKYHDSAFLSAYASAHKAEVDDFKLYNPKITAFSKALKEEIGKTDDPKVQEKLKAKLDSLPDKIGPKDSYRNVIGYARKGFFNNYVDDYCRLGLGILNATVLEGYRKLVSFLFLSGAYPVIKGVFKGNADAFRMIWSIYAQSCKPEGLFTKFFDDKYADVVESLLAKRIEFSSAEDAPSFYSRNAAPFAAYKDNQGKRRITEEVKQDLLFLSEEGVEEIVSFLNERAYSSMIDAVISFRKKIGAPNCPGLQELKTLCELSTDEIVIYDNRYYAEKQLQQQEEAERQRRYDEERRQRLEQARWEEEQRRQAAEAREQQRQIAESNRLLAEANRVQAQRAQEEERRHREQLAAQKRAAAATIDARIAELRKELFNLHGPNDTSRRLAVEQAIRDLEFKKSHL